LDKTYPGRRRYRALGQRRHVMVVSSTSLMPSIKERE
jgi:hypothetical protein